MMRDFGTRCGRLQRNEDVRNGRRFATESISSTRQRLESKMCNNVHVNTHSQRHGLIKAADIFLSFSGETCKIKQNPSGGGNLAKGFPAWFSAFMEKNKHRGHPSRTGFPLGLGIFRGPEKPGKRTQASKANQGPKKRKGALEKETKGKGCPGTPHGFGPGGRKGKPGV